MLFPTKKAPASEVSVSEQNKLSMWQFANLCTAKFRATETELCRTKVGTLTVCSLTTWNHRDFFITIPCGSDVWHLQKRIYMINGNRFHFLYFSWEYSEIRGGDIICPHTPQKNLRFFFNCKDFFLSLVYLFFPSLSFFYLWGGGRAPALSPPPVKIRYSYYRRHVWWERNIYAVNLKLLYSIYLNFFYSYSCLLNIST